MVLTVFTFALTMSATTPMKDAATKEAMMPTTVANQDRSIDSNDVDVLAVMSVCNESFRIEMCESFFFLLCFKNVAPHLELFLGHGFVN